MLEHLAAELWRRRHNRIPLQLLIETLRDRVAMELTTSTLDLELRGAPFVSRTPGLEYGFAHECFLSYFLACHLIHGLRTSIDARHLRPSRSLRRAPRYSSRSWSTAQVHTTPFMRSPMAPTRPRHPRTRSGSRRHSSRLALR